MKVVLFALNAAYVHTNLAVRCIAKELRAAGHTPVIVERSVKDRRRDTLRALYDAEGDVYGFSVYIWNRREMCTFAAQLRQLRVDARIVFGGPEVSFEDPSFFTRHPYVDNIIAGEGEGTFADLCGALPPRYTVLHGEPYAGFETAGILYDEYPAEQNTGGILYYESSRGCPFGCSYCLSSATHGVRAKSAEQTVEDLRRFERIDHVRVIKFVDRTFNFDRRRADAIWRALAGGEFTKTYHFEVCADLLDEENFAVLAAMPAGRIQLECGVQSTHEETLRAIHRQADPQKILRALARIRSVGNIHVHADLIAGLPGEDFARVGQSFDETYPVCDHLQLGFLKLLPGTDLRVRAGEYGYSYSPEPPYEVLQSNSMDFSDFCRLHAIDDVLLRYSDSGHFLHTLKYLLREEMSPFAFFEALADVVPAVRSLSQRQAFLALRDFGRERLGKEKHAVLDEYLTLDWFLFENGAPPAPLGGAEQAQDEEMRRAYCRQHPGKRISEVWTVDLPLTCGRVLIDRSEHLLIGKIEKR